MLQEPCRPRERRAIRWAAVPLWPLLCLALAPPALLLRPLPMLVALVVFAYLSRDAAKPSCTSRGLHLRSGKIATAAFAVATLLLSQKEVEVRPHIASLVLTALLFSVALCLPQEEVVGDGLQEAMLRHAASYSAGLLCLAIAVYLDHVHG